MITATVRASSAYAFAPCTGFSPSLPPRKPAASPAWPMARLISTVASICRATRARGRRAEEVAMGSLCPWVPGRQSEVMTASLDPGPGEWPPSDDVVVRLRAAGCVFAEEEAALLVEAAAGESSVLARLVAAR